MVESKTGYKAPIKVAITGAAGQIGSVLCFMIGQGRMFGQDQKVILHLLELPQVADTLLKGLVMELKDCAFPLIAGIKPTTKMEEAFEDIDVAILVGAKPRGPGMERKDLLLDNGKIFKVQGEALDKFAKKTVKVLVVGNPANTNALIASHYAPSIPKENFTALTRLDQNRAVSLLSEKLDVPVESIKNLIIWGNHSSTQYPDANHATVNLSEGEPVFITTAVKDDAFLGQEFVSKVAKRGAEIISVMNKSSVPSAANAVCDHMRDWWLGTAPGTFVSMGVISDANTYGIRKGLIYSFPVTCEAGGSWKFVEGLSVDEFSRSKLEATENELIEEKGIALE